MSAWAAKVRLADIFHNDDLSLRAKAETIRDRMTPIGKRIDPGSDELDCLLEELVDAADDSVRYFDSVWNGIYDWADYHRVWIETS